MVTGASAGIGRELVRQLVRDRGMTVLATARRLDRLESLAAELPEGRVIVEAGDLADPSFRAKLWDRALGAFPGGLDLLVNNAGFARYDAFEDQDPEVVRRIFEVNVMAMADLTRRAMRQMKGRGTGQIVQVSSVLGFVGLPYSAAYAASKHAVNGLVKSLRYELEGTGVRMWAACPNRTVSEFHEVALGSEPGAKPRRAPYAVPTERVARSIVRGLDRRPRFLLPGVAAWGVVACERLLPGPFDWFMRRWAPSHFRQELEEGRGGVSRPGSSTP